jgi:hydroxymethylpyrimidine pyrophosphatase-like HAD family hydrolase
MAKSYGNTEPVVVFSDLDHCLFQSPRHMSSELADVATLRRDGRPHSYLSIKQVQLFDWLAKGARLVPTTGRSPEQLSRVELPFSAEAICLHGAVILDAKGRRDELWAKQISTATNAGRYELNQLKSELIQISAPYEISVSAAVDQGSECYLSARCHARDADRLRRFGDAASRVLNGSDWRAFYDVSEIVFLPRHLGKEKGVTYLIEHYFANSTTTIGLGHSDLDEAFMALCDVAMRPLEALR